MGSGISLSAALRLFHRSGIPSFAVCPDGDFSRYSRWCRILPGSDNWTPRDLSQRLQSLDLDTAVLLPCSDDWLAATAALPPEVACRFPSSIAPPNAVETLLDKWRFAQLLENEGMPHPRTQLIHSDRDIELLPESAFQGAFLKPLSSIAFSRRHGVKGFMIRSRDEARLVMRDVPFPIMLQEFIPGPPTAGYFVEGFIDRQGRTCALFARRRLRMYPMPLGNSTFMESVPLDQVGKAAHALQHLLEKVSYRGPFSAEFKYDDRDGLFKLLEINARPWWYIEAPASAGMDVCRMAYLDALELDVESIPHYEAGQRFGYLFGDLRAWRHQRETGGASLWSWLRSWRGAKSTPFAWNDPLPPIVFAWRQLLESASHPTDMRPDPPRLSAVESAKPIKTHALAARR
jgi:D-aspartate ligase